MKAARSVALFLAAGTVIGGASAGARQSDDPPVAKGWTIDARASGDLNGDGAGDLAIILRGTNPRLIRSNDGLGESSIDSNPRRLVVYFWNGKDYRHAVAADHFIPSAGSQDSPCLADPLAEGELSIARQVLSVKLQYWLSCGGWSTSSNSYKFRYQGSRFLMIGFDHTEFKRNSGEGEEVSVNFLTGRKSVTLFAIDDSIPKKLRWSRIGAQRFYLDSLDLKSCPQIDASTSLC